MMRSLEPKEPALFAYHVNLERRIPADHPLRRVKQTLDLAFVAPAVQHTYGRTGNPSVPPELILRMMFLLFYYNIPSERELMEQIGLRLDFLWFLDWDLESAVPNHSVLSKARTRWGTQIFEQLFTRTVKQCVQAGLVDGQLLHIDSTIVAANAAKDSVLRGGPELVAALRAAYAQQEQKLEVVAGLPDPPAQSVAAPATATQPTQPASDAPTLRMLVAPPTPTPSVQTAPPKPASKRANVNATHVSTTDPDAHLARDKSGVTRLTYKDHRMVDDAHGVITAVASTPSTVADGTQLATLHEQHQSHTGLKLDPVAVAGDQHYGTADNFRYCLQVGLRAHLGQAVNAVAEQGLFAPKQFIYEAAQDCFLCPAGQRLVCHQHKPELNCKVYRIARAELCLGCSLRSQCTRAKAGRSLQVPADYALLQPAWEQASSPAARQSRRRRQHVMEGSFADAANNHGAKRARWRRQWRQQIQSWLIAAIQNLRLLIKHGRKGTQQGGAALHPGHNEGAAADQNLATEALLARFLAGQLSGTPIGQAKGPRLICSRNRLSRISTRDPRPACRKIELGNTPLRGLLQNEPLHGTNYALCYL
jgi:transposase